MNTNSQSKFDVRSDGVYLNNRDPKKQGHRICPKLEVIALTRDDQGEQWARVVRFTDPDGNEHEVSLPEEMLVDNGLECVRLLASRGLRVAGDKDSRGDLLEYIRSAEPTERILTVQRIGWHQDVFVLPGETIGKQGAEIVRWQAQPEFDSAFGCRGSLDDWQRAIGIKCSGNSQLVFVVSCALAAPLLLVLQEESGGFHFTGPSSQGKTTLLIVAGSVCGGGGPNGYIQSWSTTKNGLEGLAAAHNDCLLCLDELSQIDPKDAGEAAYLPANEQGKARMTKDIAARRRLKWKLLFLSTGEITLQSHIKEAAKFIRGGQAVRFAEIPADPGRGLGVFEDIHEYSSAEAFSRAIRDAALKYHGTAFREYLRSIILDDSIEVAKAEALRFRDNFITAYCPEGATGEVFRVARRFAIIAAGGELATIIGITGWSVGEAMAAAGVRFQSWMNCRGTHGAFEEEAAIKQVRATIEAHGPSRFQVGNEPIRNRLGFIREYAGERLYCFLQEPFENEVSSGFDSTMVAKVLARRGHLHHDKNRLQFSVRVGAQILRVYAIKASLLEA